MGSKRVVLRLLMTSTVLSASAVAQTAFAQAQAAPAPPGSSAGQDGLLGEVVVTATRQADTVNRVPISIVAVTQQAIDQQGLKNVQDLARVTPGLTFTRVSGQSQSFDINIRGVYSPVGAPTVGVYIDDVALQKRGASVNLGGFSTATPQLFDLERVEVLKGPQGTLYGGNSMGGTVRFITPTPSLTHYSGLARTEVSTTKDGDASYEGGVAVGGPIVQDKLGFRVSAWAQHVGGWLDHVLLENKQEIASNTNWSNAYSLRLALAWAPTESLTIVPSVYASRQRSHDNDLFFENLPAFNVNGGLLVNSGIANRVGTVSPGVPFSFPNKTFAGYTEGPYDYYGPYKSAQNYIDPVTGRFMPGLAQTWTEIFLPALTFDWQGGTVNVHSTTAWEQDISKGNQFGKYQSNSSITSAVLPVSVTGNCGNGQTDVPLYAAGCQPILIKGFPQLFDRFLAKNFHQAYSEELRFSSKPDARPFNWVAGAYFGRSMVKTATEQSENNNDEVCFLRGICDANAYGYFLGQTLLPGNVTSRQNVKQIDQELAVFGELNYYLTSKLKLTAGGRYSRTSFDYAQFTGGAHGTGNPTGYVATPAAPFATNIAACPDTTKGCPYLTVTGSTVEKPFTPKLGASYQYNERTLFYVSASKGFRPGGVNSPVNPGICAADFQTLGITQTPTVFKSDSVWNYEGGVKAGIAGRAQINASAFYIDWATPQALLTLAQCGRTYTGNAGGAAIKGGDVQAEARLFEGLTVSGSFAYQDAYYTKTVFGLGNNPARLFAEGEQLRNVPKVAYTLGAVYRFDLASLPAYLRGDYEYRGEFARGAGPGDAGYDAVLRKAPATHYVSARAGVTYHNIEANLFVLNLTNSQDRTTSYRQSVQSPEQVSTTFRPRTIGVQATLKY